jgi:phosphoribosyl 1,2-cyclic phosphate phosphodiesterase
MRYRSSLLIKSERASVVIDAGPEFRLQALRARVTHLDALLVTHGHSDHVVGLDDVRPFTREQALPVYANAETLADIRERFGYIFRKTQEGGGKPKIELREAVEAFSVGDLEFIPIRIRHGELPILGWRTGAFAYITDASFIPEPSFEALAGVTTLVINGLRRRPHETHFSFDQAFESARRIGARKTYLIHMCHELSHAALEDYCAAAGADIGAAPAWDGLEVEL